MFHSLDGVDWELLYRQKLVLLAVLEGMDRNSSTAEALRGLVHLLDALQDDAEAAGRWAFPGERVDAAVTEPPLSKRYYVEDDEGHHYGPLDDYEEAATVADAVRGRIIAQEVDRPALQDEDSEEGGLCGT
jgi:hypothetical protein